MRTEKRLPLSVTTIVGRRVAASMKMTLDRMTENFRVPPRGPIDVRREVRLSLASEKTFELP